MAAVGHEGRIVDEAYWHETTPTTRREAFSITKSITATLVGIAQDRDLLDLDQPAADFIPEWRGTPSEVVTIRNLVSNDSGRFQDLRSDYVDMAGQAADKTAFSIGLDQQHDPGTEWVYNNAAIQTLEAVLEEATGMDVGEFAEATAPSQELNEAYGYLWWLNHEGTVGAAVGAESTEGQLVPGAPEDIYAALGLGNQVAAVFPSSGIVVTRLTAVSAGESTFGFAQIVAGVEAALTG